MNGFLGVHCDRFMSDPAWLMKWQAREALKNGRPEEAHRLLDGLIAAGNRRAWALRSDVTRGYFERAEKHLEQNHPDSAWTDLAQIEALSPGDRNANKLRDKLIKRGLAEVHQLLEDGKPLPAMHEMARMRERPIQSEELTRVELAVQNWALAEDYAERGEFAQAKIAIEKCRQKLPESPAGLERFERDLERRENRFAEAFEKLHDSRDKQDSREMLRHADSALAVAPLHREAQTIRSRAWQSVQFDTAAYRNDPTPNESNIPAAPPIEASNGLPVKRFFLWIDGVGAYLVCLANQVTLGQASAETGPIDIPLMADVSRFHATLKRDEENYILESSQPVMVNGRALDRAGVLQSGDSLALNTTCAMRFDLPVPGCASARLDFPGTRRLPMAVDAVLLMADMLVLGPGIKVHVSMPELEKPIRLFRQKDKIGLQYDGDFYVEGQKQTGRAILPSQGSIHGPAFTLAIEPVKK